MNYNADCFAQAPLVPLLVLLDISFVLSMSLVLNFRLTGEKKPFHLMTSLHTTYCRVIFFSSVSDSSVFRTNTFQIHPIVSVLKKHLEFYRFSRLNILCKFFRETCFEWFRAVTRKLFVAAALIRYRLSSSCQILFVVKPQMEFGNGSFGHFEFCLRWLIIPLRFIFCHFRLVTNRKDNQWASFDYKQQT